MYSIIARFLSSQEAVAVASGVFVHFCGMPTIWTALGAIAGSCGSLMLQLTRRDGLYDFLIVQNWFIEMRHRLCYLGTSLFLNAVCAVKPRLSLSAGTVCGYHIITLGDTLVVLLLTGFPVYRFMLSNTFARLLVTMIKYAMKAFEATIQAGSMVFSLIAKIVEINHLAYSKFLQLLAGETLPFVRAPLGQGEIRLLVIHKRIPLFPLQLTLFTTPLQDAPPYEAISYSWGSVSETREISVNGQPFRTSIATYDALYSRSSMWRAKTVWIDYICVDQNNLAEKAVQVAQMCSVYERASKVVVCLGQSVWTTMALILFHELLLLQHNNASATEMYQFYERKRLTIQWHAFTEFLGHRWFSRAWVIQEVAVAREVQVSCGIINFEWDTFTKLTDLFRPSNMCALLKLTVEGRAAHENLARLGEIHDLRFDREIYRKIAPTRATMRMVRKLQRVLHPEEDREKQEEDHEDAFMTTMEKTLTVPSLLAKFHEFDAFDGRDKLYALLGMAVGDMSTKFTPDYTKTQETLYRECAKEVWLSSRPFDWIAFAGIGDTKRTLRLPTWVPDWTSRRSRAPLTAPYFHDEMRKSPFKPFTASKLSTAQVSFDPAEPNVVIVEGLLSDQIELLTSVFESSFKDDDFWFDSNGAGMHIGDWKALNAWHEESWRFVHINYAPTSNLSDSQLLDAYWRILICDSTPEMRPAHPSTFAHYQKWVAAAEAQRPYILAAESGDVKVTLPTGDEFWRLLEDSADWGTYVGGGCSGKRLCATPKGRVGVVPPLTEVGDLVFIAKGASTPWVLRPVADTSKVGDQVYGGCRKYLLVGECYIHDIMDGEAMDESATEPVRIV